MHHPWYTISIDAPFLSTLAKGLLARFGEDPLALAGCTIFLPTRRSCRALADILLNESGKPSLLLPRIQAIGDVEEDALEIVLPVQAEIAPAIAKPRRILLLANEIKRWFAAERERILTYPEACQWATSLCTVLDETQRYHAPLETLSRLLPPELPEHRQDLLDFLSVIITKWPAILRAEKALDPEQHREALMQAELAAWQATPPAKPVIIAGSTGSVPSTATLMKAIARLPQGFIILPGMDAGVSSPQAHHPQYPLHRLVQELGAEPDAFCAWVDGADSDKQIFARTLFSPAIDSSIAAMNGLSLLEADNETHEASMIALLLRDTLEQPGKTAMLVTPDRALAARVTAMLTRWDIAVNDSAGQPLAQTPAGSLLLHSLRSALQRDARGPLLSVLKHPLTALGLKPEDCREEARLYEMATLRERRQSHNPNFAKRLDECFAPLELALKKSALGMEECLAAHWQSFLLLMATDEATGEEILTARPEGAALLNAYESLMASAPAIMLDAPHAYEAVLAQLLGLFSYRPAYGLHPRLSILSPMEARLMEADRVIVSSLNDGEWPRQGGADWLGERLRALLGLPGREDAESHAGQDFMRLFSAQELVLIRARYQEGSPRNPHAWVLRMALLLNRDIKRTTHHAGDWAAWAHALLSPLSDAVSPLSAPEPSPPLDARPTRFSASDIAHLMQQPYRYYAERILNLKPVEPLELELEAHLIGNAIHKALEVYTELYPHKDPFRALQAQLKEQMVRLLPEQSPLWKIWQPRLDEIARNFIAYDEEERRDYPLVLAEIKGETTIGIFCIRAKADRIGIAENGEGRISDYKTGSLPENGQILNGTKPQLPIESLILNKGGFKQGEEPVIIHAQARPVHWKLSGTSGKSEYTKIPDIAAAHTQQQLLHLLECFHNAKQPYICIPLNSLPNYDAYLHLARIGEIHSAA